jgi:tRNA(Ile2) C34 agmatinyltransferase TiaS
MTRANLQHALDFCEFCWREVSMNEYATNYLNVTIANLTQALAQHEPSPIAYGVRQIGAKHVQYFTHSKEAALKAMEKTPNCEAVALGEVLQ